MTVIDNLESSSKTDALSANMGRELNDRLVDVEFKATDNETAISNIDERVATLENNPSGGTCDCETKIWTTAIE